jgi:amino acid permease
MPFVFSKVGLAQGILIVSFCGMLSAFGLTLLAEVAQVMKSRSVSFNSVAQISYPSLSLIFDLAVLST